MWIRDLSQILRFYTEKCDLTQILLRYLHLKTTTTKYSLSHSVCCSGGRYIWNVFSFYSVACNFELLGGWTSTTCLPSLVTTKSSSSHSDCSSGGRWWSIKSFLRALATSLFPKGSLRPHEDLFRGLGPLFSVTRRSRSDSRYWVTYWVSVSTDLTDVTLVSDDTY